MTSEPSSYFIREGYSLQDMFIDCHRVFSNPGLRVRSLVDNEALT